MGRKPGRELRRGWTTGACAAAATGAAYAALLTGAFPDPVTVRLPGGERPSFPLAERALAADRATAAVVKDAGDDPDVTHGALVRATVRRLPAGAGVAFRAGEGVGTVTLPGLPVPVGEPAINPAPRAMMRAVIAELAAAHGDSGDVEVTVAIPGGLELARRTMNGRLGIEGGLSVLGTTGVVIPYSCASWIHAIHRGIDVARAIGLTHVAAATGSTSERAVQAMYGLPETALIDMGDFVGGTLKYLRRHPIPRLTLAGGFAKLTKLAQGHLDLHSGRSSVDVDALAALLAETGAPAGALDAARGAATANQLLQLAGDSGRRLGDAVADRARRTALERLDGRTAVEVLAFDREARLVGRAAGW
ncbi:MAG TPA: cobalt-precorrin-5B (C(1))-methyltransferase [Geminicoccaceae bacterium]|nr:cobalt-precorrin-5B (C(1))-methyltransferase [Geminicoccaceae bacterium]